MQWHDPEIVRSEVEDSSQKELMGLETVLVISIEEFKKYILRQLEFQPPVMPEPKNIVFLDTSTEDLKLAKKIGSALNKIGIEWCLSLTTGSPSELREDLINNFTTCNAAIVIYGNITRTWVKEQIRFSQKLEREAPLSIVAVYDGPPHPKSNLDIHYPELKIIDGRKQIDVDKLKELLFPLIKNKV